MNQLQSMSNASGSLFDQVSFMSLNVFGRTIGGANTDGRQHNPNHQVSLTIGKPFASGVLGGIAPVGNDFGATNIGAVTPGDSLASYGKTVMSAVGIDDAYIQQVITSGSVVKEALS